MSFAPSPFEWILIAIVLIEGIAIKVISHHWNSYRRAKREEGRGKPWALRRVPAETVDRVFATPAPKLGHTVSTEVAFISIGQTAVVGAPSDYESWILAVLARQSSMMFEFGTCTGRTTYLWARNSPPGAKVITLTLHPDQLDTYRRGANDRSEDEADALKESAFQTFVYTGTDVEHKVVQLYGDSKAFDHRPYQGRCDLIFVDGSHARSYVESDSQKALQMVKPGGIVLWHDYRGPHRSGGVFHALNALSSKLPLMQIEGTSLVAYRAPL